MIQQLSWFITNQFIKKQEIPEEDGDIYAFGFECILATIIQIVILLTISLIFNCIIKLILFSFGFTSIKKYIGGWHANSHFACITATTTMSIGSVYLCNIIPHWVCMFFLTCALLLIVLLAPIPHNNNPKTEKEIQTGRRKAIIAVVIEVVVIYMIFLSAFGNYAIYAACGLFMSSISLLLPNTISV